MERIVGRVPADFRKDPGAWSALVHPDDRAESDEIYATLRSAGSASGTYRVVRPDGAVRWVEDRAWLAADVLPSGPCFVGIVNDVTDRRLAEEEVRRSEESLRALLNATHASIYLIDGQRRLAAVNEVGARALGFAPSELIGRSAAECMPPDVAARRLGWIEGLFTGGGPAELEDEWQGRAFRARAYAIRDGSGAVGRVAIYAEDVTEARRTERALVESEARWRAISGVMSDFAFSFLVEPDGAIQREWVTPSLDRIAGVSVAEEISEGSWLELVHPDDRDFVLAEARATAAGGAPRAATFRIVTRAGVVRHLRISGRPVPDPDGRPVVHLVGAGQDVTEQVRAEEALRRSEERFRHEALHDALTGIANRRAFLEQAARAVDRARRRRHAIAALLYLDLDRFKPVNDRLGHERGDELLAGVARRLEASVRPGDVVGRLGGDEFGILLDDVKGAGEAIRVAERVQRAVAEPFDLSGHEARVGASIGIAFSTSGGSAEELLREADMALYRAKRRGPGRTELFDAAMQAAAALQMELEAELATALDRSEVQVLFQPVVSLEDRGVCGAESLLRWRHPRRGVLVPADFLELAEETGTIVPIGRWALRQACRAAAGWPAARGRPLRLLVNVSARELREERFAGEVFEALSASRLSPERLELEVSEATLAAEAWGTPERLDELVREGVRLSLDDFGRASLPLSRLRLPFRVLKLDRSLVRRAPGDGGLARAAVALAHTLGLTVVAEGVETAEEMDAVREAGCDEAQGSFVSPPLPADELCGVLSGP